MADDKPNARWNDLLLPVLTVAGGFGVYFLLFRVLVDPMNPDLDTVRAPETVFLWETETPASVVQALAADLDARYSFAVPTVLMSLVFIAALIVAFGVVLPQFGRMAIGLGIVVMPIGVAVGLLEQYNNPLRALVADCPPMIDSESCPLNLAVRRIPDGWLFDAEALRHVQFLVSYNSAVSVAAIGLIGICAIFIARTVSSERLNPDYLKRRRAGLETMLTIVGPLLVFSVATTHGFYHFAAALMADELSDAFNRLASSGTLYWGAVYSTVLIVVTAPATVSVARDARRAAEAALPGGSFAEHRDWCRNHGVEIALKEKLRLATAILAPVLTTPALDLLRRVVG